MAYLLDMTFEHQWLLLGNWCINCQWRLNEERWFKPETSKSTKEN